MSSCVCVSGVCVMIKRGEREREYRRAKKGGLIVAEGKENKI